MLSGKMLGGAGRHIVIEEFLSGEEASFMVLVDGHHILPLASSQDHKARDEGDQGPNTGGMGAYSPAPVVDPEMHEHILREIIEPTVHGLAAEGTPYTGFLYAGLMIGADRKPRVLEYNVRLGDPETQPILLRLRTDLLDLCLAATEGRLDEQRAEWDPGAALGVVLTAGGYPGGYRRGDPISGLPQQEPQGTKIFHAGTALRDGRLVTDGGRVLCVTSLGRDIRQAAERAYEVSKRVRWAGIYYRRDIGQRALARDPLTP
jgi:phosphoribosylamine--glycine ligase